MKIMDFDIISGLTVEIKNGFDLLEHPCIASVQMQDGHNTERQQGEPYSREEYQKVRREIDTIISQIKIPDDPDSYKLPT